jgi:beta-lactamase regulating signal transducer with metallopeptidase domain
MPTIDVVATALLTYAGHSAVACVIALLVARVLRRPHERDLVWKAALIVPLVTAPMAILGATAGATRIDLADLARRSRLVHLPGRKLLVRVLDDGAGPEVFRQLIDPVTRVLAAMAIGIAVACVALAGLRLVRRRRALAGALAGRNHVRELTAAGSSASIRLSSAIELQSPVALGASEICLPSTVLSDFPDAHRDTLIAHEMAHLERRDPFWFALAEGVAALTAFQPLVFVVLRAFRRDVELICDEAAVRCSSDRQALIGALALLASPFDPRSPIRGAATAYDGSPLVARATRIATLTLDGGEARDRRIALAMVVVLAATLCVVPVVSPAPRLADLPMSPRRAIEVARAEGRLVTVDSTVTERSTRLRVLIR